jgi:hypothetical protein
VGHPRRMGPIISPRMGINHTSNSRHTEDRHRMVNFPQMGDTCGRGSNNNSPQDMAVLGGRGKHHHHHRPWECIDRGDPRRRLQVVWTEAIGMATGVVLLRLNKGGDFHRLLLIRTRLQGKELAESKKAGLTGGSSKSNSSGRNINGKVDHRLLRACGKADHLLLYNSQAHPHLRTCLSICKGHLRYGAVTACHRLFERVVLGDRQKQCRV